MKKIISIAKTYLTIAIGTFILALSINMFFVPHKIVIGGVSGIATVIYYLFRVPIGFTTFLLNVPLLIWAYKKIDVHFVFKALVGAVLTSVFLELTAWLKPVSDDIMLSAIIGGALSGVGMGLVFSVEGTTGGSDIVAVIVKHFYTNIKIGQALLFADIFVIGTSAIFLGNYQLALYGAIGLYISSKAIDTIIDGINYKKLTFIITDKPKELANRINKDLERGVTGLNGKGMYTGKDKIILMCAFTAAESYKFKRIIKEVDPKAFVIMTDSKDVSGQGFSRRLV